MRKRVLSEVPLKGWWYSYSIAEREREIWCKFYNDLLGVIQPRINPTPGTVIPKPAKDTFNDDLPSQVILVPYNSPNGLLSLFTLDFEVDGFIQPAIVDTGSPFLIAYNITEQFHCNALEGIQGCPA